MNKQNVLIFKLPELFNILNELKNHLDFTIYSFVEKDKLLASNLKSNFREDKRLFVIKSLYNINC